MIVDKYIDSYLFEDGRVGISKVARAYGGPSLIWSDVDNIDYIQIMLVARPDDSGSVYENVVEILVGQDSFKIQSLKKVDNYYKEVSKIFHKVVGGLRGRRIHRSMVYKFLEKMAKDRSLEITMLGNNWSYRKKL